MTSLEKAILMNLPARWARRQIENYIAGASP